MNERRFKPDYQESFSRYFQDELRYLKDLGSEFAKQDPGRIHFEFDAIDDPDVKCLLEGFSFLTARLRQNLDDELPELTHSLLNLLFPHYLRPIPSMTVVQFTPQPGAVQSYLRVPAGSMLNSKPVDDTACQFRTAFAVDLLPIDLKGVELDRREGRRGMLKFSFAPLGKADLAAVDWTRLRLYVRGEEEDSRLLMWVISTQIDRVRVRYRLKGEAQGGSPEWRTAVLAPETTVRQVGFETGEPGEEETHLLPFPPRSFPGYRLLQEYFSYPKKFHFFDLVLQCEGGGALMAGETGVEALEVYLEMDDVPPKLPRVHADQFALHCTPVVNLFPHEADPLTVDHTRPEYLLRPQGADRRHYEIWCTDSVHLIEPDRRVVPHFFSFHSTASAPPGASVFYETRLRPSQLAVLEEGTGDLGARSTDTYLRFVTGGYSAVDTAVNGALPVSQQLPQGEKLSVELWCTNRHLPQRLAPKDICEVSPDVPSGVTFRGIEPITRSVSPPLGHGVHWQLLSHLSLNALSLASVEGLRGILEIYDFQAQSDSQALRRSKRRLQGLSHVESELSDRIYRGAPIRVVETELTVDDEGFMGVGDMYMFGCVLEHFLSLYVAANCLSKLSLRVAATGFEVEYPARGGGEVLL